MTIVERVEDVRQLWTLGCPDVPLPTDARIVDWCGVYSHPELERGLTKAFSKVRQGVVRRVTQDVERYATGVMISERRSGGTIRASKVMLTLSAQREEHAANRARLDEDFGRRIDQN